MFSGKELCRSLACFVIGGIITVIFINWNGQGIRSRNRVERQIPIQEIGNRERQEKRIVQGDTVKRTKIPLEQDDKVSLRIFIIIIIKILCGGKLGASCSAFS